MQILVDAYEIGEDATRVNPPDAAVMDSVLSASRSLMAVATRSLGAAAEAEAEETTIAQYRARADRRAVLVSVTAAGRLVMDQATARRRALIEEILVTLREEARPPIAVHSVRAGEKARP